MERDQPWTEHERVYLLCEVLKASPISSQALLSFLRQSQIDPRWNDTALPPGRSLRSSQIAYDNMFASFAGPDYRRPPMLASAQPMMYPGPEASRKRPYQENAPAIGRLLQPRPPQTYPGEYIQAGGPAYTSSSMMSAGEPANKKKRGRPTKAEAQQRAQEAAARGEVYPPPRRGRVSITAPPEPSPLGSESQPQEQEQTPPHQQPVTTPGSAMTPQHQMQPEPGSESSSGKRRRTKPEPLELENPRQRTIGEMESPSVFGSGDPSRNQGYMSFTPISAPLPSSSDSRDRDIRMEGVEEAQPRTTTPHSFKDTVGI